MIKKILNIYRYITEHIIVNNEKCMKFYMESYTYSMKRIIFLYDDYARIYLIHHSLESVSIEAYYTIDYSDRSKIFGEDQNINFDEFIKNYPKDEKNSKEFNKKFTNEELEEYLEKYKD